MKILGIMVALVISQASELPGAGDATFEQRWQSMIERQIIKKQVEEIVEPRRAVTHETHHRRARHATGCRFGHKVYHGKSWRCRR